MTDAWPGISSFLSLPRTQNDLDRLTGLSDYLIDQTKGDESHPLMGLLDIVGTLISDFERENIPEPEGTPQGLPQISDAGTRAETGRPDRTGSPCCHI
ncbi:MAG TPA: hypothetical protein ENK58_01905 [Desulfobacterales bacterium]|nr:hypothetical protein [Desulfobacterales bacterium]